GHLGRVHMRSRTERRRDAKWEEAVCETQGVEPGDEPGTEPAHRRDAAPRSCGADGRQDEQREDCCEPGDANPSKHGGTIGRKSLVLKTKAPPRPARPGAAASRPGAPESTLRRESPRARPGFR